MGEVQTSTPVDPGSALPLRVLICDADAPSSNILRKAIEVVQSSMEVSIARSLPDAVAFQSTGSYNAVFIDPITSGLEEASSFVFDIRHRLPIGVVFVIYVDRRLAEADRDRFYRGQRSRFAHYITLDKATPSFLFTEEVRSVLTRCRRWLLRHLTEAQLVGLQTEAEQLRVAASNEREAKLPSQVEDILARLRSLLGEREGRHSGGLPMASSAGPKSVFLSHRFSDREFTSGLIELLKTSGFDVITGEEANTYISDAILDRIARCEYFLCLMTPRTQKVDGTFTTSPWLLEEKGAALALRKRVVLMVQTGVTDVGGLQGDYQRIEFSEKEFLKAALQAVRQLRSYAGGNDSP